MEKETIVSPQIWRREEGCGDWSAKDCKRPVAFLNVKGTRGAMRLTRSEEE